MALDKPEIVLMDECYDDADHNNNNNKMNSNHMNNHNMNNNNNDNNYNNDSKNNNNYNDSKNDFHPQILFEGSTNKLKINEKSLIHSLINITKQTNAQIDE